MFVSLVDANGKLISTTVKPGVAGLDMSDLESFKSTLEADPACTSVNLR